MGLRYDNTTTWIQTTKIAEIEVGMTIKVVETYEAGTTVTYEGEVEEISDLCFHFETGVRAFKADEHGCKTVVYRQPRKLPLTIGSAIKVYDTNLLRDRIGIRKYGPNRIDEPAWYWADAFHTEEGLVPAHLVEKAEIVFDAGSVQ